MQNNLLLYNKYNKIFKITKNISPSTLFNKGWSLLLSISTKEGLNHEVICTKKELDYFLKFVKNTSYYYRILENKKLSKFFIEWRYNIFTKKLLKLIINN